jgi:hypothetical protein
LTNKWRAWLSNLTNLAEHTTSYFKWWYGDIF